MTMAWTEFQYSKGLIMNELKPSIGIDLGGTSIAAALVDAHNRILAWDSIPTRAERGYSAVLRDTADLVENILTGAGLEFGDARCVGVGSPGSVEKYRGIVNFSSNLGWHNASLKADLEKLLSLPVYVENDANTAALGEYIAGIGASAESMLMVTLGTGIGGGFILNGSIYEGVNCAALEIGHMVIRRNGRPCPCGRQGCFERYASASGLILTAKEYMTAFPDSLLWELTENAPENMDGRVPFDAMRKGDRAATRAVEEFLDDLSCGLVNLINIFQPEIIALGGGLSGEGEALLSPLRERINTEIYTRNSEPTTKIIKAALGSQAGVIGAAKLYIEHSSGAHR
jgi:glucokinase